MGQPAMVNPVFRLLLRMEIERADGSVETVVSDPSWQGASDGPMRRSGIYFGETYDATKEQPGWDQPGFAAAWRRRPHVDNRRGTAAGRAEERADPRRQGTPAGEDDRAEAGRLCLRHGAKHGRLVPFEGPRAGGREGRAAPRGNAQRRRHDLHGQPPRRRANQRIHAPRRRRGGLRAAFHLSRVPLRGSDGPARAPGARRDPRPRVPFRRARRGAVRVFQPADQPVDAEHRLDAAGEPDERADRLPATHRARRLDGRHPGLLADGDIQHGHGGLLHEVGPRTSATRRPTTAAIRTSRRT